MTRTPIRQSVTIMVETKIEMEILRGVSMPNVPTSTSVMTTGKSFDIDYSTLQMFTRIYRGFMGKSECGDFKFVGIACYPQSL